MFTGTTPGAERVAIAAIESTLAGDADNLSKIWALDNVQRFYQHCQYWLFNEIKEHCESERKKCFNTSENVNENITEP